MRHRHWLPSTLLFALSAVLFIGCSSPAAPTARKAESATPTPPASQPILPAAGAGTASSVYVKKNTDGTGDGFLRLVTFMEKQGLRFYASAGRPGIIARDDVVLLKINSQWDQRGGTNTDLVKSVMQAITRHPDGWKGEIVVVDNGQEQFGAKGRGGSMDWENNNAVDKSQSIQKVVDGAARTDRVSAYLWDTITNNEVKEYSQGDKRDGFVLAPERASTGAQVSYAKFKTKYGTYISFKQGIWDEASGRYDSARLKVLNMPVLKSHSGYQVTAAVKHYMGTTSDKLTRRESHNGIAKGFMGTQIAGTRVPALNILDAIWINPQRGPGTAYAAAVQKNMVLASVDPVALDVWAAKNILIPAAQEAGNRNWSVMDPLSKEPGTFGYWLALSYKEMKAAGLPVTMDESQIRAFIEE